MAARFNLVKALNYSVITLVSHMNCATAYADSSLEEVIVTAQKREQLLQKTPIAISVLNDDQLRVLDVYGLEGLKDSIIPSVRINANGLSPSTLTVAIRGDGASDVGQPTREPSVGVYLDGIYLGRAQGLSNELADLERIEILRGPQGTLYGRNSTTGAVNLVSKKPTGQWGIDQSFGTGNYDLFRSVTRINTPEFAGFKAKIDYIHSERDGWVKNTLAGQADFNEFNKSGGKLSLTWEGLENLSIDYSYDQSDIQQSQMYYQLYEDTGGAIGRERNRETTTRFPLVLKPVNVDIEGHSLIASWEVSENVTIKSLSAYREMYEDGFNNHGGTLYSGGLILNEDIEQEQYSQEFQVIGSHTNIEWTAGLFYFEEDYVYDIELILSLNSDFTVRDPLLTLDAFTTQSIGSTESKAVYGQGTWSLTEKFSITAGARYTQDKKSAQRSSFPPPTFQISTFQSPNIDSDQWDYLLLFNVDWSESISSYIKASTAYKAGGYNARSATFLPYEDETNETIELGVKSEWLDKRVRLNSALFYSNFEDKQFDFLEPANPLITETLNAVDDSKISGVEFELTAIPLDNLTIGLNYTYLNTDLEVQPHPDGSGATQPFKLSMAPQHAGSITLDYAFPALAVGYLNAHLDISSTDRYAYSNFPDGREDAYTLLNARISLDQAFNQNISLALWGKNITDEEYAVLGFPVENPIPVVNQIFGTPRTFGLNVTYQY